MTPFTKLLCFTIYTVKFLQLPIMPKNTNKQNREKFKEYFAVVTFIFVLYCIFQTPASAIQDCNIRQGTFTEFSINYIT